MGPELSKAIVALSERMRLIKAMQESKASAEALSERDFIILNLLAERGRMTVSEIASACPDIGYSTISTDVTRLWRDKQMLTKTIDPDNQRVTIVELTEKGEEAVETVKKHRVERFQKLYEAINVTDGEKEIFLNILNRAIKYFDELLGPNNTNKQQK